MFGRGRAQNNAPAPAVGVAADDAQDAAERACKKHACMIQRCLSRSNYQQARCTSEIERWDACVKLMRAHLDGSEGSPMRTTEADAGAAARTAGNTAAGNG
jgi:Mature-T-Cell Proliferation I type